jgi:hypothetical protein
VDAVDRHMCLCPTMSATTTVAASLADAGGAARRLGDGLVSLAQRARPASRFRRERSASPTTGDGSPTARVTLDL